MASNATVARPYAKATFELAAEQSALADWSQRLSALASTIASPELRAVVDSPSLTRDVKAQIVVDCMGEHGSSLQGLVKALAEHDRLGVVDELAEQYELLLAQSEKTLDAEVSTAIALTEAQQQTLIDALSKRFGCAVTLNCQVDESLIGGAMIRAGDVVIDGSIKGRLDKLALTVGA